MKAKMGSDVVRLVVILLTQFSICCTIALVFVYIKCIYLVCSAWIINISLRNPFVNAGWYAGLAFAPGMVHLILG